MPKFIDLTGRRFGRLIVIERCGCTPHGDVKWKCLCDCGCDAVVIGASLKNGSTKSCGCLLRETIGNVKLSHGCSRTRLYKVWLHMKDRCYNRSNKNYHRYGGRGITVCDEWRNDFGKFQEWAMANGYDENAPFGQCTIDRIDNDKGYRPDNCRWADMKVQRNNQSKRRKENRNERYQAN